jgi:hypothetical protein
MTFETQYSRRLIEVIRCVLVIYQEASSENNPHDSGDFGSSDEIFHILPGY